LSFAENWPGWRGPRGDGSSIEKNLPTQWGPDKNILWKTEIPGMGHSSPIVWENRLFIASSLADKQQRLLLCLDALSGKILWQQVVLESPLEKIHNENSFASGTPATDGQKVYVAFLDGKSIAIAAYDFTGKQVWLSRLDALLGQWGFATSPVVYNGQVILNSDSRAGSFLVSLSCTDGRTLWKVPDTNEKLGFSVPLVRQMAGRMQLVQSGNQGVYSYNPDDGSLLWFVGGVDDEFVTTSVYHEGLQRVYVAGSWPKRNFLAIDVKGSGDVTKTHVAWSLAEGGPNINSPVIVDDFILGVDQTGAAKCFDAKTGKAVWGENLGKAHASAVVIDGLVYFLNDDGVTNIVKPGPEFKSISKNELGQTCYASPAVSQGRIYFRGKTHLFCVANP
jgi:hypothetical protein